LSRSTIRAAVIGLGRVGWGFSKTHGASHVSCYLENPRTELVGVADPDRIMLEDFKAEHPGVAVFRDYERMLYEVRPEIVSVATPTDTHCRIVRNVARYEPVRVIFAEKPLAPTVEEAERMVRTCEEFGVKLACNLTRRWDPAFRRIKGIVEKGVVGDMLAFSGRFSGDPIGDGVHMADLANWYRKEDTRISLLNVPSPYLVFEADLWGSNGLIRILDNGSEIQLWKPRESRRYAGFRELERAATLDTGYDFSRAMRNAVEDLVECATTDKWPDCDGRRGLEALKLCLEVFG